MLMSNTDCQSSFNSLNENRNTWIVQQVLTFKYYAYHLQSESHAWDSFFLQNESSMNNLKILLKKSIAVSMMYQSIYSFTNLTLWANIVEIAFFS